MKKLGFICSFIAVLMLVSLAFASWKGTGLRLGITTQGSNTSFLQSVSYETMSMTNGTYNGTDVSGINAIKVDTSVDNATINSFANGVDGQFLHIVVEDSSNGTVLTDTAGNNQEIYLSGGSTENITSNHGGWTLLCNGTDWIEVD